MTMRFELKMTLLLKSRKHTQKRRSPSGAVAAAARPHRRPCRKNVLNRFNQDRQNNSQPMGNSRGGAKGAKGAKAGGSGAAASSSGVTVPLVAGVAAVAAAAAAAVAILGMGGGAASGPIVTVRAYHNGAASGAGDHGEVPEAFDYNLTASDFAGEGEPFVVYSINGGRKLECDPPAPLPPHLDPRISRPTTPLSEPAPEPLSPRRAACNKTIGTARSLQAWKSCWCRVSTASTLSGRGMR